MRAGPGGARLIILIKEQQGARDCNMSYALSQIAKSSDRTQNNANSLVSGRLNPGNVSTKEKRVKVARENDLKEKMILILIMRTRQKMNAPISRFDKRLSRGRGGSSGYIFVKRGKGPILQKVISLINNPFSQIHIFFNCVTQLKLYTLDNLSSTIFCCL